MTKRLSIKDVARVAGVAPATVSKSLNGDPEIRTETRERVTRVARDLGYQPSASARNLAQGRTQNVAVAVHSRFTPVILDSFYAEVLAGIEEELEARDLHLLITSLKRDADLVRLAGERRADGLIVIGSEITPGVLHDIARLSPLVLVDRELEGLSCAFTDNAGGMARATEYILTSGRTRPAFICETPDNPNFAARLAGFRQALTVHGIDAEAAPVQTIGTVESAYAAARHLLTRHRPDALVCSNDAVALYALRALQDAGVDVPGEVALMGFDGRFDPRLIGTALTTMWVDKRRLGREGARLLVEHIDMPGLPPGRVLIPTELRVGQTA